MHQSLITRQSVKIAALVFASISLGGCIFPNSSNPVVTINQARITDSSASLDLTIENPSDFDLQIDMAQWSLIYVPLPVAEGQWTFDPLVLPSGQAHAFSKQISFETPPLDPEAGEIELAGILTISTVGNTNNTTFNETSNFTTTLQTAP